MNSLSRIFKGASQRARRKRAAVFRSRFNWIGPETRVLDLGSRDGSNIARVLEGLSVTAANIHIADVNAVEVRSGAARFGFTPVVLEESEQLPFTDRYFDLVYCSSVIEHVTIPKHEVWRVTDDAAFHERAAAHQRAFAAEIRRVARAYFVQTPNRAFPIESHTWLPFMSYLPRRSLVAALRLSNRIWIKSTAPDWRLLRREDMALLFPDAEILCETVFGMTKSFMAVRGASAAQTSAAQAARSEVAPLHG